jgi:hypothetical protein
MVKNLAVEVGYVKFVQDACVYPLLEFVCVGNLHVVNFRICLLKNNPSAFENRNVAVAKCGLNGM